MNGYILSHSRGPWKKHKYIKKVGGKYYYKTKQSGRYVRYGLPNLDQEMGPDFDWSIDDPIKKTTYTRNADGTLSKTTEVYETRTARQFVQDYLKIARKIGDVAQEKTRETGRTWLQQQKDKLKAKKAK